MSSVPIGPVGLKRPVSAVALSTVFWMALATLLPAAELLGGMAVVMMALAVGLSVAVWVRPQEAPAAGVLYLFACSVIFPYGARLIFDAPNSGEMYYWAVGLFLITATAMARLGVWKTLASHWSLKALLAVAMIASFWGVRQGVAASYVLRQFYGVFLMIVYFGIALHTGSEDLLVRRIQTFGSLCAIMFFIYFAWVFAEYGFHREQTTTGTQAALLAAVLFVAGIERRKPSYFAGAILLLCVPLLLFQRGAVLLFLSVLPLAGAIYFRTIKARLLFGLIFIFIALPAYVPGIAGMVGEYIGNSSKLAAVVPGDAIASDTLLDRALQLGAAMETVRAHPLLGMGMGSEIGWDSPTLGYREVPFIENGWAYLLQKMGILGAVAFGGFLFAILGGISRESLGLSACLLAAILLTMFNESVFFHFTTSPFVGTFAGLLLARKAQLATPRAAVVVAPKI